MIITNMNITRDMTARMPANAMSDHDKSAVDLIPLNDHFEEEGQIISRETIERSIDEGEAYRIMCDGKPAGGVVIKVDGDRGNLDLLFVSPGVHSRGIGHAAWCAIEKLHPEVTLWETVTPYFEKRNIHFYVNRCGFHIVEFYNRDSYLSAVAPRRGGTSLLRSKVAGAGFF